MLRSLALVLALCAGTWVHAAEQVGKDSNGIAQFFKILMLLQDSWFSTADSFGKPRAWNGAWPQPRTVLYFEPGGVLHEHMQRWRELVQTGSDVEVRGPCFSACTMIMAVVPKERLCFGDYASLQFHLATDRASGRIAINASMWMLMQYPRDIYDWPMARGGVPNMGVHDFWVLEAPELWAMGYRRCAPERAPLMTIDQTRNERP
jgi:hypothetical protein